MSRMSEQDAAYCAAAWAGGTSQKELARQFGYKTAAPVCVAIERFVSKYGSSARPEYRVKHGTVLEFGTARKALVPEAIKVYQRILELREQERSVPVFPQSVEQIRDKMREEVRHATYWSYPEPVTPPPPPAFAFGRPIREGSTPDEWHTMSQYLKMGAGPIDCHAIELDSGAFTIGVPFTSNTRARRKAAYRKARTAAEIPSVTFG